MLRKMFVLMLSALIYASIFSAASSSQDVSFLVPSEAADPVKLSIAEFSFSGAVEDFADDFAHDGTWVLTEGKIAADGRHYFEDMIYERLGDDKRIIRRKRYSSGEIVAKSIPIPLAPKKSEHYCYNSTFTPEENRLLQFWVDKKCIKHGLKKRVLVHRFSHMGYDEIELQYDLLKAKERLLRSQFGIESYIAVYKEACYLVQKELLHSCFFGGYILGAPLTRAQRPRALTV